MTATEFNKLFDDVIKQIKDAKRHWILNPTASLAELRIDRANIEEIIKLYYPKHHEKE